MVPAGYDISDKYRYGACVPAGNSFELTGAFIRACDGDTDRAAMADKLAARTRALYDWDKIIDKL